jgi:dolichol-phosphate mannosyltransferase
MKALVIIPTYNEKDNIKKIVLETLKQDEIIEILVVDDGSPDGTGAIVDLMMKENPKIHLLERKNKMGLGSAYVAGFKFAIKNEFDFIIEMDADFSHNPKEIPNMLREIKDNDLIIGSRYIIGINVINWSLKRLLLSYFASIYVRIITGMDIKDPTGGFKCFKREVLESIDLDKILSDGYSFQVEMNFRTWCKNYKIKEIPIVFTDRQNGTSKMSKKIVKEAIWMVWYLRILKILGRL